MFRWETCNNNNNNKQQQSRRSHKEQSSSSISPSFRVCVHISECSAGKRAITTTTTNSNNHGAHTRSSPHPLFPPLFVCVYIYQSVPLGNVQQQQQQQTATITALTQGAVLILYFPPFLCVCTYIRVFRWETCNNNNNNKQQQSRRSHKEQSSSSISPPFCVCVHISECSAGKRAITTTTTNSNNHGAHTRSGPHPLFPPLFVCVYIYQSVPLGNVQ